MNKEERTKADNLHDAGLLSELYCFLEPFLAKKDPYAMYHYSSFSLSEWNESAEEFDRRRVDALKMAAEGSVPGALYQLAALYFVGDGVEFDPGYGRLCMEKAMSLDYGLAKYSAGVNMYFGSNGYAVNIDEAIRLVSEARDEGVEGAADFLKKLKSL